MTVKETIEQYDITDIAIKRHGFTDYMRDYELYGEFWLGGKLIDSVTVLFRGCAQVHYETILRVPTWEASMDDDLIDYDKYKARFDAGTVPDHAFIWGVKFSEMYPGWQYVENSAQAASWSERLGVTMHEVRIETNHFDLSVVFQSLVITMEKARDAAC